MRALRASLEPKPETGLALLFAAIANAVACAGGDEAGTLARLERELAPKSVAKC